MLSLSRMSRLAKFSPLSSLGILLSYSPEINSLLVHCSIRYLMAHIVKRKLWRTAWQDLTAHLGTTKTMLA